MRSIKYFFFTALLALRAFGAITFVNAVADDDAGIDGTTLSLAATNHTAGNLLYVIGHTQNNCVGLGITLSVSNTAGDTFTSIGTLQQGPNGFTCEQHWYAKNIIGNASDVVTLTASGSSHLKAMTVLQFSGLDTVSPLDVGLNPKFGSSVATVTSNAYTTTAASEVLIGGVGVYSIGETYTPDATDCAGGAFTIPTGATGTTNQVTTAQYCIVSSTQTSVTQTITLGTSNVEPALLVATFKAAGAAPAAKHAQTATVF